MRWPETRLEGPHVRRCHRHRRRHRRLFDCAPYRQARPLGDPAGTRPGRHPGERREFRRRAPAWPGARRDPPLLPFAGDLGRSGDADRHRRRVRRHRPSAPRPQGIRYPGAATAFAGGLLVRPRTGVPRPRGSRPPLSLAGAADHRRHLLPKRRTGKSAADRTRLRHRGAACRRDADRGRRSRRSDTRRWPVPRDGAGRSPASRRRIW